MPPEIQNFTSGLPNLCPTSTTPPKEITTLCPPIRLWWMWMDSPVVGNLQIMGLGVATVIDPPPTNAATKATFEFVGDDGATIRSDAGGVPGRVGMQEPGDLQRRKAELSGHASDIIGEKGGLGAAQILGRLYVQLHLQFAIAGRDRPADPSVGIAQLLLLNPGAPLNSA